MGFDRSSDEPSHVEVAAYDLTLRPVDEGCLSVYKVEGESDSAKSPLGMPSPAGTSPSPSTTSSFPLNWRPRWG